jgi:hypothetical protein
MWNAIMCVRIELCVGEINAVETDDKGMFDLTKLQQNIEHAAKDF